MFPRNVVRNWVAALLTSASLLALGCSSGSSSSTPIPAPVVASVAITTGATSVAVGATQQFAATAMTSSGTVITGLTFTWASSSTSVATINSSGLATGVAAGTTSITAATAGVTSPSDTLTVTAAAAVPTSLSFSTAPTSVNYLGLPLSAIKVTVLDQHGNVDTAASGGITLALAANPPSATLSGTLAQTPVSGVATFSNLTFNYPAENYTLTAAYSGLPTITSSSFSVLASHNSLLSISGETTTTTNWWTHTAASFPVIASTTGGLVLSTLTSTLNNGTPAAWTAQPTNTISYSNLASTPYTIATTAQTSTGTTDASTLTWVDCANLDTATVQPMAPTASTCAGTGLTESLSAGGFSGFADPTMRKDLSTGTVWLGYSWPYTWNPGTGNGVQVVDLHIASSPDNGVTWSAPSNLWESQQITDPNTGKTAYTSNEIMNIVPGVVNGQTAETWFDAHLNYFVDQGSTIIASLIPNSTMVLNWATAPTLLGAAPTSQTVRFAAAGIAAATPYDVKLNTLDPSLANCQQWAEPALYMKSGNLYLATMCKYGPSGGQLTEQHNFYAIFETTPNLAIPMSSWTWTYNGQLATSADAALLEGHEFIYEMDLATRADGTIVAIVSPADELPVSGGAQQYTFGCRALVVAGLDKTNIGLAHDANGQLEVLASITVSDLSPANGDSGSGACTYEPLSADGIVINRSYNAPDTRFPALGFYVNLFNTYVMP